MIKRDELTNFIYQSLGEEFLVKAATIDTAPNAVQLKGSGVVTKIVLGVSASPEFINQAIKAKANYALVHHGLSTDWLVKNGRFDLIEGRLKSLISANMTLAGFHYALDAHPTLGNNAVIIDKLGAKRLVEPYFGSWGWVGEFACPVGVHELAQKAKVLFQHDIFTVFAGPGEIKRIGVCSGGGRPRLDESFEILDKHLDLHLTGEISESGPYLAEAGGFNYFAAGHYATEVFGVQALGKVIKDHFGSRLEVEFIDLPNVL